MSRSQVTKKLSTRLVVGLLIVGLLLSYFSLYKNAYGDHLGTRSLQLSSSVASDSSKYNLLFTLTSTGTLGSVQIQFCANDPIIGDVCTVPPGMDDLTSSSLSTQTGQTGFSIDNGLSSANSLVLTRTPTAYTPGPVNFVFSGVVNPSSPGSYYVRIQTFPTPDASGSYSDYGGIAFAINSSVNVSATVPPYLLFCTGISIPNQNCSNATGDFIDFGNLSDSQPEQGTSQMLVATNAGSGYDINVYGTTLLSGNNVIGGITSSDVSRPGTAQFGFNLRANSSPAGGLDPGGAGTGAPTPGYNSPNFYQFNSGDIVASNGGPDRDRLFTNSYIVNVPATQAPGVYVSTLTYICVATF